MDQKSEYLIQVLEQIGLPLVLSVIKAEDQQNNSPVGSADAVATLLAKTVETSLKIGELGEFKTSPEQTDSLRLALACVSSHLTGALYQKRRKFPETEDLQKISDALQAILSFSQNFEPSAAYRDRLANMEAKGEPVKPDQIIVQYLQAFGPVINAVGAFSFGQPGQKLITEVAGRLTAQSEALGKKIFPSVTDENDQKLLNLALLKVLADLYSTCHSRVTNRLAQAGEDAKQTLSIDAVWQDFEFHLALLEALGSNLVPGANTGTAPAPPPQATAPIQPQQQPSAAATPATPPPAAPVAPPSAPAAVNPMAMFAAPKTEDGQSAEQSPPQSAPQPVAPPPQAPAQTQPEQPVTAPPPPPPDGQPDAAQNANPMSFFTQPPKENDDE